MRFYPRLVSLLWLPVLIGACVFVLWTNSLRMDRVSYVSELPGGSAVPDPASSTGYSDGKRRTIIPEQDRLAQQWVMQAQEILASGEWRLKRVTYDNAPHGREVRSASPYRWWLSLLAKIDHTITDKPLGLCAERAASTSDMILHLVLIVSVALALAWKSGSIASAIAGAGLALSYPLGAAFSAGQPDDYALFLVFTAWSILPLLLALGSGNSGPGGQKAPDQRHARRARPWAFGLSGLFGAVALWVQPLSQLGVLGGIVAASLIVSFVGRDRGLGPRSVPTGGEWIIWGVTGAVVSLVAWALDRSAGESFHPNSLHLVHALGWLAAASLLHVSAGCAVADFSRSRVLGLALAAAVLVSLGVWGATRDYAPDLAFNLRMSQLTKQGSTSPAGTLLQALGAGANGPRLLVALLPLLALGLTAFLAFRRQTFAGRQVVLFAIGPVLVAVVCALFQLRWLSLAQLLLIIGAAAAFFPRSLAQHSRMLLSLLVLALCSFASGTLFLIPGAPDRAGAPASEADVTALLERDLAHWLASMDGPDGSVVLASPGVTASLIFHGGVRGLATPYPENADGLTAALRIASSTLQDEAHAMVQNRRVTHVVLTSWDPFLSEYAEATREGEEKTLASLLAAMLPPRWLRPVPYQVPQISGFEAQKVSVFEVVDVQEQSVALSRLAEYFIEMGQLDNAVAVAVTLEQHFPADINALIARAHVMIATQDADGFRGVMRSSLPRFTEDGTADLLFDRRISLAIALAQGERFDLVRTQVEQALREVDEAALRSLAPSMLYRFLVVTKVLQLELQPPLREYARNLLPAEMQQQL